MDFFNNQGDNSKQNEDLLDAIMEQQKKREKKHNVKKGYLLNKSVGTVSNPFDEDKKLEDDEPLGDEREFKHKPVDSNEPVFVVGNRYSSKKQLSSKAKLAIVLSVVLGLVLIAATFCMVFFLTKHKIEIVCSSREGVVLLDERGKEIETISLRMYESTKFKVEVKVNYSQSEVEVWYNNKLLTGTSAQDKYGYYTIKYTGETNELRITGVVENDYDVKFDSNSNFDYRVLKTDGATEIVDGKTLTNFYGNKITFTLYDSVNGLVLPQHLACVYDNGVLLNPNEHGEYELNYNQNHNVTSYFHSPFEWFIINTTYKEGNINEVDKHEVVGLSDLGKNQSIIKLPQKQNDEQLTYNFVVNSYYRNVSEVIISNALTFTPSLFDHFTDLQTITVSDPSSAYNTYYSDNGLLYYKEAQATISGLARSITVTNNLVKIPMGYGKKLAAGSRVLTVNPDVIATGAIYRLNYITTLYLGPNVSVIQPLALSGVSSELSLSVRLQNNTSDNFTIENNIVYNKAKTLIVNAQLASGEVTIASGVAVSENAFSCSNVTAVTFAGTSTAIGASAFAIMPKLETIVVSSNIGELAQNILFGCNSLKTIDLRNVTGVISINDNAVIDWSNIKLVVVDENLEAYRTQNATKPYANCFVSVSEFDAA
ncbi:MAG: leucine-rich repeat protein [Clostridia bacterium]|nr:leucine-rich repeat protein [Clostridia bacterium]